MVRRVFVFCSSKCKVMHPKKNYLMYICIVINDINILSQKRDLGITIELRLVSWKQSFEYPSVDKKKEKYLLTNPWWYKERFALSGKYRTLVQKHGLSICWNTGASCCFVFSRFWAITVLYNSPHQMCIHNYNCGLNDTRLSFMFLYLCHFLYLFDLLPSEIHMDTCCSWVEKVNIECQECSLLGVSQTTQKK